MHDTCWSEVGLQARPGASPFPLQATTPEPRPSAAAIDELGFDGVDAGGLDKSWRQQPGTPVYAKDFDADGVRRALSEAKRDRTPEWRATPEAPVASPLPLDGRSGSRQRRARTRVGGIRQGWNGRPVRQEQARGVVVVAPGVLAWKFGAKMPANTLEEET